MSPTQLLAPLPSEVEEKEAEGSEWEYEEEDDLVVEENLSRSYCRPESFVIPIGGVWHPTDEVDVDRGPSWGKVEEGLEPEETEDITENEVGADDEEKNTEGGERM